MIFEKELVAFDENGFIRTPHGQFTWYQMDWNPLLPRNEHNEFGFSYDVAQSMKDMGYALHNANKIVHCQTLEDPTHSFAFE